MAVETDFSAHVSDPGAPAPGPARPDRPGLADIFGDDFLDETPADAVAVEAEVGPARLDPTEWVVEAALATTEIQRVIADRKLGASHPGLAADMDEAELHKEPTLANLRRVSFAIRRRAAGPEEVFVHLGNVYEAVGRGTAGIANQGAVGVIQQRDQVRDAFESMLRPPPGSMVAPRILVRAYLGHFTGVGALIPFLGLLHQAALAQGFRELFVQLVVMLTYPGGAGDAKRVREILGLAQLTAHELDPEPLNRDLRPLELRFPGPLVSEVVVLPLAGDSGPKLELNCMDAYMNAHCRLLRADSGIGAALAQRLPNRAGLGARRSGQGGLPRRLTAQVHAEARYEPATATAVAVELLAHRLLKLYINPAGLADPASLGLDPRRLLGGEPLTARANTLLDPHDASRVGRDLFPRPGHGTEEDYQEIFEAAARWLDELAAAVPSLGDQLAAELLARIDAALAQAIAGRGDIWGVEVLRQAGAAAGGWEELAPPWPEMLDDEIWEQCAGAVRGRLLPFGRADRERAAQDRLAGALGLLGGAAMDAARRRIVEAARRQVLAGIEQRLTGRKMVARTIEGRAVQVLKKLHDRPAWRGRPMAEPVHDLVWLTHSGEGQVGGRWDDLVCGVLGLHGADADLDLIQQVGQPGGPSIVAALTTGQVDALIDTLRAALRAVIGSRFYGLTLADVLNRQSDRGIRLVRRLARATELPAIAALPDSPPDVDDKPKCYVEAPPGIDDSTLKVVLPLDNESRLLGSDPNRLVVVQIHPGLTFADLPALYGVDRAVLAGSVRRLLAEVRVGNPEPYALPQTKIQVQRTRVLESGLGPDVLPAPLSPDEPGTRVNGIADQVLVGESQPDRSR